MVGGRRCATFDRYRSVRASRLAGKAELGVLLRNRLPNDGGAEALVYCVLIEGKVTRRPEKCGKVI
jgi:hypothetical protein